MTSGYILARIVVPATAWAFLVPAAVEFQVPHAIGSVGLVAFPSFPPIDEAAAASGAAWGVWLDKYHLVIPACYIVASWLGYLVACCFCMLRNGGRSHLFLINVHAWFAASTVSALLVWGGLAALHPGAMLEDAARKQLIGHVPWLINQETAIACWVPLGLLGMHVLHSTVYVGLRRDAPVADLDREWLARLSGWLVRIGLAWTALALCCLVVPRMLPGLVTLNTQQELSGGDLSKLFGAGTLLGCFAAWLGKQVSEQLNAMAAKVGGWLVWVTSALTSTWLLSILAAVFAILLIDVLATIEGRLLGEWADALLDGDLPDDALAWFGIGDDVLRAWLPIALQVVVFLAAGATIWSCHAINVNRFSMHAVYRNRLTRAFLGSARVPARRRPDPFTGLALTGNMAGAAPAATPITDDNPRLKDFRAVPAGQRLFPIINMTLNVTAGSNTAWAERQGESFIATPIVCGAAELRHPDQLTRQDLDRPLGAFVATESYAGAETTRDSMGRNQGIRIGSAMTISGAAISPNWGYHSSRATALLMMLFNVRLGAWLPNPSSSLPAAPVAAPDRKARRVQARRAKARTRHADRLQVAGPRNSLVAMINELLGATTDAKQAIYLSDGGHFENLGLYEMLRRRCRSIVVVDAGQDGDCAFFDLGNAIRKAEIDLGAVVTMRPMHIYPRAVLSTTKPSDAVGVAVGDIEYAGGTTGLLVYLKPTLLPGAPAEVVAYARDDDAFPHISTLDQWFTESEFESYRALGAWQTQQLIANMVGGELRYFFDAAAAVCPAA